MSQWKKSSQELVDRFVECMESINQVEMRKMFGYPCSFLNGNMLTGLHEENWILRLDEPEREALKKLGGNSFEPMGRLMKEYVTIPLAIQKSKDELAFWMEQSVRFVSLLPPKAKKPRKSC
ncbi:MAG: TfoX/Sxy family protein [Chlamydiia bacterium]|nr:TfoX/Sxy family protein [Chlamydiia bacterium]